MSTVIGLDYGTQSARAILVDTRTGEILRTHSISYPHGVIGEGFASVWDYEEVLLQLLDNVLCNARREDVVGICVDATSFTLVPLNKEEQVLCQIPEFADRKHAQIKLWKYHGAQSQAEEALSLAKDMGEKFLGRTGGELSCEGALPKLLQIRDEDAEIYSQIDLALDLCEFLTFRLTGKLVRSAGPMGYKGLWAKDISFPSDAFLNGLRPGFAEEYKHLMRGEVKRACDSAGVLKSELTSKFGLKKDVVVATGVIDGHTSMAALGALQAGDAALVLGTSNVLSIQSEQFHEIEGICGVVWEGMTPGKYAVEGGQNCTGDMLEWYIKNMMPGAVEQEAKERRVSSHQLLMEQVTSPWENEVVITDWWNGSRNTPCNLSLRGTVSGLSLYTKPVDIYLALLQSIVCGTREIIEKCMEHGVAVNRLVVTGGMAEKNPLLMREYASLLNRTIYVGQVSQGPALGAAIFAAVAAGIYSTPEEAYEHMGIHNFVAYEPDREHREAYEALYKKNHALRNVIGI